MRTVTHETFRNSNSKNQSIQPSMEEESTADCTQKSYDELLGEIDKLKDELSQRPTLEDVRNVAMHTSPSLSPHPRLMRWRKR